MATQSALTSTINRQHLCEHNVDAVLRSTPTGSIDYDYYIQRGHRLRSIAFKETTKIAFGAIGRWIKSVWHHWRQANKVRAARAQLMRFNDHQLRDIGISRRDIHAVVSGLWTPQQQASATVRKCDVVALATEKRQRCSGDSQAERPWQDVA